ncbi:MAG: hypothetical protein K0R25_89 [Rickettsiaceae bacterium]|jgi:long-chain fatty acid transport protein|nr:hypothetical protein [Rickettsiaceae bacterium]
MKLNKKLFLSSLAFLLANQSGAIAAGYSTNLYSASGLGNAYAGSATGIHDSSDIFFNPSVVAGATTSEAVAAVSFLRLNIDADNVRANSSGSVSGTESRDAGVDSAVPAFYVTTPINDNTTFGLAITSPFGLATKYDRNWVGKYHGLESSVMTININPSISYKLSNNLSVGAGFQSQYYKAKFSKAINDGGAGYGKSDGDDWGYGYNLGANYKFNDQLKFGIGYRSKIEHKLNGTTKANISSVDHYSGFNARTATPESLTAGTSFKLNNNIELAYDLTWTRWSRLKSLVINSYDNPSLLNIGNTTIYNWRDSFLHSVGANFDVNDKWLIRTGAAFEKDATSNATREPRIPTGDRVWATLGFDYKISNSLAVDAAYVHQFYRTTNLNVSDSSGQTLQGQFKTHVDVLSVGLKKQF